MNLEKYSQFTPEDTQETRPAMKIGLLATVTPEGLPHVTMLSSLMAHSATGLCFGQFTEGNSKTNIIENSKTGFLIMSLKRDLWRGKADYTQCSKEGPEFDYYNNVPMFRYNAYFGVHTVYYLDLVSQTGKSPLPMNSIIFAAVKTMLARTLGQKIGKVEVLNSWTRSFLNKLDNLKFLAYIGPDGYPRIIPAIQAQNLDGEHILFSTSIYQDEIDAIPNGADICVFGLALSMEDVLLRGKYNGIHRKGGIRVGVVQVDWVYNPMPPVPGQIYPPVPLTRVEEF
jgi:hypothetical protein